MLQENSALPSTPPREQHRYPESPVAKSKYISQLVSLILSSKTQDALGYIDGKMPGREFFVEIASSGDPLATSQLVLRRLARLGSFAHSDTDNEALSKTTANVQELIVALKKQSAEGLEAKVVDQDLESAREATIEKSSQSEEERRSRTLLGLLKSPGEVEGLNDYLADSLLHHAPFNNDIYRSMLVAAANRGDDRILNTLLEKVDNPFFSIDVEDVVEIADIAYRRGFDFKESGENLAKMVLAHAVDGDVLRGRPLTQEAQKWLTNKITSLPQDDKAEAIFAVATRSLDGFNSLVALKGFNFKDLQLRIFVPNRGICSILDKVLAAHEEGAIAPELMMVLVENCIDTDLDIKRVFFAVFRNENSKNSESLVRCFAGDTIVECGSAIQEIAQYILSNDMENLKSSLQEMDGPDVIKASMMLDMIDDCNTVTSPPMKSLYTLIEMAAAMPPIVAKSVPEAKFLLAQYQKEGLGDKAILSCEAVSRLEHKKTEARSLAKTLVEVGLSTEERRLASFPPYGEVVFGGFEEVIEPQPAVTPQGHSQLEGERELER